MARPNKIRYSGVAVAANGYTLSRVQNVSADTDLGEEEAKELTNAEVVEYTSTSPQISISIETNEYGSCRNIRAIAGVTGGAASDVITISSFENTAADIGIMVAEDSVLARTCLINDAFLSSLSWNYDVGGVATESFNFDSDNKLWYAEATREAHSVMGTLISGDSATGHFKVWFPYDSSAYDPLKLYVDGVQATGDLSESGYTFTTKSVVAGAAITCVDTNFASSAGITTGYRYRAFVYKNSPNTTIAQKTSSSTIGSIPRGKLSIYLSTGETIGLANPGTTNFLRLQSLSIDVDLAREALNELGHYRAFERSLTYPVPVNVSFSTIANDLTEWAKFSGKTYKTSTVTGYDIGGFLKNSSLGVGIYDKQDTDLTRNLLKSITVTGLQIVSESFGVDVGGNGTQDFTAKANYFIVSGVGAPGTHPLVTTVPSN